MTIPRLLLLFCAFLFVPALEAQEIGGGTPAEITQINGRVVDASTQQPLSYATVSLFSQTDSSLVTGNITDENGQFSLEADPGNYYIEIEFLAYQKFVIDNISIQPRQAVTNLGIIELQPSATTLNEVVVEAERSRLQMSLDKKVFNVGQDLASSGGNAADVLDNVPSVQVDVEGNVSLRGSGGVRILVNGKPSGLVGVDNTNGLRQIPANLIERVEVITNPSARYQAEGMTGIINIILKKETNKGFNGSFDLNVGVPQDYGTAFNLNYRTNKLNLFANYGISYRRRPGRNVQYQEVYGEDTTFITQQFNDRERGGLSNNVRVGADLFLNPRNIITTAFNYRTGDEENDSRIEYLDYLFTPDNPIGASIRTDNEKELESNLEYALTYRRTFEKEGQEFTLDFRYQDDGEEERSDLLERFLTGEMTPNGEPDLLQRSVNMEQESQFLAQADYIHPFGEEGRFEAGWLTTLRNIDNEYLVEEFDGSLWNTLVGLSNDFIYGEDIHAAYLIFGNKTGKFSYQLGLRGEMSDISTQLLQTEERNDRSYLNFFPSAHVSYELPGQNAVQVSYSRRIERPRFWDLNPFFSFSDNRNFFSGNPNLNPEFTHAVEIGHIKYWDMASLTSSLYFRHTDGKIEDIRRLLEDGNFVSRPENLLSEDAFGLEVTGSFEPYKWWKLDGSFNFFRSIIDGGNLGPDFQADNYSWFTRGTSRFTIWKKTDVQLRFDYRAPRQDPQGRNKSMYSVDLAISRDIFNDNGTLTLSARDLFNSRRWRYVTFGDDFYTEGSRQWRARQITLSLNYRLNQNKERRQGRGDGGDGDGGGEEGF